MNENDAKVEPLHLHLTKRAEIAGASRGNPIAVGYIYVIQAEGMQIFKIGQTVSVESRLGAYITHSPIPCHLRIVASVPKCDLGKIERQLHGEFSGYRSHGEWFNLPADAVTALPDAIRAAAAKPVNKAMWAAARSGPKLTEGFAQSKAARNWAAMQERITTVMRTPRHEWILDRIEAASVCSFPTWREICESLPQGFEMRGLQSDIEILLRNHRVAFYDPERKHSGVVRFSVLGNRFCIPCDACMVELAETDHHEQSEVLVRTP